MKNQPNTTYTGNEIAIIGMAGRFPDAQDIAQFWDNLKNGVECITSFSDEELIQSGVDPKLFKHKNYVRSSAILDDPDYFDAKFFGYNRAQAELLDPQQRLLLECGWEVLEDSGYDPAYFDGDIGVFIGVNYNTYYMHKVNKSFTKESLSRIFKGITGNDKDFAATRMSYKLGLSGPSLVIQTACSTSLVCTHQACQSILNGECDMAIAGGVKVLFPQKMGVMFEPGMIQSPDGHCRAFDAEAKGTIGGNGIGLVMLKRLPDAIEDGDNIYAVIKGSAINNDGNNKVDYEAPSVQGQADVIAEALAVAQVNPETVSYVEAHGTGTTIGDPIEISALTSAFRSLSADGNSYCAIGSIKTNMGHLESAAGVASLMKTALSFKHEMIPPSINFSQPNPLIKFPETPFFVNDTLRKWPQNGPKRRAGVSSFGIGGTNAHVVMEEAPIQDRTRNVNDYPYYPLVLSAKTDDALQKKIDDLRGWLKQNREQVQISDIAYTLCLGRRHFSKRASCIVKDFGELEDRLGDLSANRTFSNTNDPNISVVTPDEIDNFGKPTESDPNSYFDQLSRLVNAYIHGESVDWLRLFQHDRFYRISLPTYPFDRQRYWLAESDDNVSSEIDVSPKRKPVPHLHSLIDRNISTLAEQAYETTFDGDEFYLTDHVLLGQKILPAVVYLEMARAAASLARPDATVLKIRNIIWPKPLHVNAKREIVRTCLVPGKIDVNYVISGHRDGLTSIHSQGKLYFQENSSEDALSSMPINVEDIKKRCVNCKFGEEVYARFRSLDANYGSQFQPISEVYCNSGESLAKLQLPDRLKDTFSDYALHPSLMDGALQAVLVLIEHEGNSAPVLPFSLAEIEIFSKMTTDCFVYVRRVSLADSDRQGQTEKFDLDVISPTGDLLVGMRGFVLRRVPSIVELPATSVRDSLSYYMSSWNKLESANKALNELLDFLDDILIIDIDDQLFKKFKVWLREHKQDSSRVVLLIPGKKFEKKGEGIYEIGPLFRHDYMEAFSLLNEQDFKISHVLHCLNIRDQKFAKELAVTDFLENSIYSVYHLTKAIIDTDITIQKSLNFLYFYTGTSELQTSFCRPVSAFAKSINQEHTKFHYKTVELADASTRDAGIDCVLQAFENTNIILEKSNVDFRIHQKEQLVKHIRGAELSKTSDSENSSIFRYHGTYLITGGMGGIGLIIAEYLAETVKANLVLIGRSTLDVVKQEKLQHLQSLGGHVIYLQADISQRDALAATFDSAKCTFESINGIFHCAGVINDSFIRNKSRDEFSSVLAPKVQGTLNLDLISQKEKVDFFVLSSSVSAVSGNGGQSDYATANSFMDSFAEYRESLKQDGNRYGKTVSINWPYWQHGGMTLSEEAQTQLTQKSGFKPLTNELGIQALNFALQFDVSQLIVTFGDSNRIERYFSSAPNHHRGRKVYHNQKNSGGGDIHLCQILQDHLSKMVSELIKVDSDEITLDEDMSEFGLDSITLTEFSNNLNDTFGLELTPAEFFEHSTLGEFTDFLINNFSEQLTNILQDTAEPSHTTNQPNVGVDETLSDSVAEEIVLDIRPGLIKSTINADSIKQRAEDRQTIAVIGMSGVLPGSEDLNTFWLHLENESDLVTEIPPDRWNWQAYAGDPNRGHKTNSKWGGFIKDIDKFDAAFFRLSKREVELMDPQQRLFLETVWKTIEDAGYDPSGLENTKVGLFVGIVGSDYAELLAELNDIDAYSSTGLARSILPNRVSFLLNLRGPSEPVDTACSSSLVAIHRAVQSIRNQECEMAIAGGVNALLTPTLNIAFSKAGMLSPDGCCRVFDKNANGYVRGEGVASILLKPLAAAEADGDHIYGVIRASAVNHGGHSNSLTAPNPNAQSDLLIDAYDQAQIDPTTVTYIETHGTGTKIGDPIEINGLKKAFKTLIERHGGDSNRHGYCGLGSVKTNTGHLEASAGIASVIKVLLAMTNKTIPGNVHFEELNPYIDLSDTPFYVVQHSKEWESLIDKENSEIPRRAGVSSFGFGGSNCHIVFEEYVEKVSGFRFQGSGVGKEEPLLIVLSAKNEDQLQEYAEKLLKHVSRHLTSDTSALCDLAYTLQVGRQAMNSRLAMIVGNRDELVQKLTQYSSGELAVQNLYAGNMDNGKATLDSLLEDQEINSVVNSLVQSGNLSRIAKLWVAGVSIDWEKLASNQECRRMSLPTYPFSRDRYWIPEQKHGQAGSMSSVANRLVTSQPTNNKESDRLRLVLEKNWQKMQDLPSIQRDKFQKITDKYYFLAIVDKDSSKILKGLKLDHCIAVRIGHFYKSYKSSIQIRQNSAEDGIQLISDLKEKGIVINAIIDLSDLRLKSSSPSTIDRNLFTKIMLLRNLVAEYRDSSIHILHFTRGRVPYMCEHQSLAGAGFSGLIKMLSSEYRNIIARTIDIDDDDNKLDTLRDIIYAELITEHSGSECVYRLLSRYQPSLSKIVNEKYNGESSIKPIKIPEKFFDPNKTIIITGGTRGIGGEIARYFVAKGSRKIVLMGRQNLPDRKQWPDILNNQAANTVDIKKIEHIQFLEKNGATVMLHTGSLSDKDELETFIADVRTTLGPIGGVIHCAGLVNNDDPAFIKKNLSAFEAVFKPKVQGLFNLHDILQHDELLFFILFSSVSSLVPVLGSGVSDYAAANSFMDDFARFQANHGKPYYRSIQWPSWNDIGMGESKSPNYVKLGLRSHSTHEGLMLFETMLSLEDSVCAMPCIVDANRFQADRLFQTQIAEERITSDENSTKFGISQSQNSHTTLSLLSRLFAEELKISVEDLGENTPFEEFGVDSILIAQLIVKLEELIGERLEPAVILEHSTLSELDQYLNRTYGDQFENLGSTKIDIIPFTKNMERTVSNDWAQSVNRCGTGGGWDVAVVGMACNFPGAPDINSFWKNLKGGKSSIIDVPSSRWHIDQHFNPIPQVGKSYSKWGGFIPDIDLFDPSYFGFTEDQAPHIDPLIRQFLEISAQTFSDAGYERDDLCNQNVGVFVGSRTGSYPHHIDEFTSHSIIGLGQNFIAAHISHVFNLHGPSFVLDSACSSSLLSIHLACQSLFSGESDLALAGGVDILLDETPYLMLSSGKALSPDGKCHVFDRSANGIVLGEGCGAVLLKRLDQAITDGDKIYSVIEASAVNNDGHTMGITTPNPDSQEKVIASALAHGGIDPGTISCVEAHGTGTMIGDPIELKGLSDVYRKYTQEKQYCAIGSVKSNLGHLLSAAGIASFIKVGLSLQHRQIPPTLNCQTPNSRFQFASSPFFPNLTLRDWLPHCEIRRGAISSFGFGGTNCHMIVREFDPANYPEYVQRRHPLAPIIFNRKKYWFNREKKKDAIKDTIVATPENGHAVGGNGKVASTDKLKDLLVWEEV